VFNLVYLGFYFLPWFFKAPSYQDVIAATIAIGVFVPIFIHGFHQSGLSCLRYVAATSLIGFAVSPFFGTHGIFHIYAMSQLGNMRPERTAWISAVGLTIVFSVFALLTQMTWWDFGFPILMGIVTMISMISQSDRVEQNELLERSIDLEQHLATLAERERIAQDLHDLLGQTLTMVSLKSELAERLLDEKPSMAKQELSEIRDATKTALRDMRQAVTGMNSTTLKAELQQAKRVLSAANIALTVRGDIPSFNAEVDNELGLSVREAMTNVVRHSLAKKATFNILQVDDNVIIDVEDDGNAGLIVEGSGLSGLIKRIQKLGGTAHLEQNPGLKISMQIPYAND